VPSEARTPEDFVAKKTLEAVSDKADTPKEQGQADPKPTEAQPRVVKVKGRDVPVPPGREDELLSKGMAFEANQAALNAAREQWRSQQQNLEQFEKLQAALRDNPTMAQAVAAAIQDPSGYMKRRASGEDTDDGDLDDEGTTMSRQARSELDSLRAEVSAVKQELSGDRERASRARRSEMITDTLREYPWCRDPKRLAVVKAMVEGQVPSNATELDIRAIAGEAAGVFKDAMEAQATEDVVENRRKQGQRSLRARELLATVTNSKKEYKKGEAKAEGDRRSKVTPDFVDAAMRAFGLAE